MSSQAEDRMKAIAEEIESAGGSNMNSLLAPEPLGLDEEKLSAEIRFVRKEWETNERGEIHGGAISAMFDTAMGMTVLAYSESEHISTADLDVSFIRPFLRESYIFRAEVLHPGRMLARARAVAYDEENGKVLASATANFVHLR